MEKKLLLAIFLSFIILYVWAGLTQPSRTRQESPDILQVSGNKEDTIILNPPSPFSSENEELQPKDDATISENIEQIESEKLIVEFSNIGGKIKKVLIRDYDTTLPISNFGNISGYENVKFKLEKYDHQIISYSFEDENIKLTNTYQVSKNDYTITVSNFLQNKTEMSKLLSPKINGISLEMSNLKNENGKTSSKRDQTLFEYVVNSYSGIHRKNNAFKFSEKERKKQDGHVEWVGFRDRYFCAIIRPDFETTGYEINPVDKENLNINVLSEKINIPQGGSVNLSSTIFIGPERSDILKSYELGFEKIKKFYRFGLFDIIAMAIYSLMNLLYKIIPNWGVSIVLISTILYFAMYPLTLKGMNSMKKMQALQPEISKLKEKYKENPQKMNQEMMKIYKENKINPVGGCVPFLFQMPVFIGLYQVLWRSVTFKGAKFLWIKDLSEPDRLFILPFHIPFMGNEINILPIFMMIVMFVQQKISSKNMTTTDPVQLQQQKMMGTVMPVLLGVIFYKFASGLTLYFAMFYVFSTFTQFKLYKKKKVT